MNKIIEKWTSNKASNIIEDEKEAEDEKVIVAWLVYNVVQLKTTPSKNSVEAEYRIMPMMELIRKVFASNYCVRPIRKIASLPHGHSTFFLSTLCSLLSQFVMRFLFVHSISIKKIGIALPLRVTHKITHPSQI